MIGKENIASKIVESGGKLHVKSALNPILWLCAIITIPSLIVVPFIEETPTWLIILIVSPVITAILGFFFLLVKDRDKLQSEEYQLRKRSMELIQEKGENKPKIIDTETIEISENPETVEIPRNNQEEQ
ncbi:hypothetical protein [Winogradskyella vincentii]|uniref:Positive regulator of sigma(E), RseC/MucC n=1 Tax=Winogradskyella vincentii TaxID=2877122 RepID=A0ABS7Y4Z2_9FLAO|nr:hypothetical protein [Winogradskyella vincentii]MCA0153763.1 hypothetical protein [Winogradskyella vincentii]